jgi:hypothetical protein
MKIILLVMIACILSACVSSTGDPADQRAAVQTWCARDAMIRPIVTGLLPLATPDEILAIKSAEAIIDAVCAHPSADAAANQQAALAAGVGQILAIEAALIARRAGG